ncbi:MAG: glycoside hydrolase family 43 protein [Treponema sp.]|nr:glycoside hydrolase family 43 protein [Treponema sp.]
MSNTLSEKDFEGYLFGHFIGEGDENGEQIYFAVSEDGLNFHDMNGGKPVLTSVVGEKGVRDPFLFRSHDGKGFFLIATDLSIYHRGGWFQNEQGYYDASTTGSPYLVLWQSQDLVNWSTPKLIKAAPENAGMAWAPEMVFDEEHQQYVIFFSSSIMDPATKMKAKPNAIYYVTTKDFETFSDTKLFIDCQVDKETGKAREIIDTTVLKVGDWYYSVSKDGDNFEKNGGILVMKTKNLLDYKSWEKVLNLSDLDLDLSGISVKVLDNTSLEGPELFQFNQKDWANPEVPEYGLIADQYMAGSGYLPLKTTNLEDCTNAEGSWQVLKAGQYSFDKLKKRHGTILRITKEELDRLKKHYK